MSTIINTENGLNGKTPGFSVSSDTTGTLQLQTNSNTAITIDGSQNINIAAGNLTFGRTGTRIFGDFSNATSSNRVSFQSSTTNGATAVGLIPNGTSTFSGLILNNASDPNNTSQLYLQSNGSSYVGILSEKVGTGTYLPMVFTTGGAEAMRIGTGVGVGALDKGTVGIGYTTLTGASANNSLLVAGNVGIGTSSPAYKFDVQGGTGSFIGSSGVGAIRVAGAGGTWFWIDNPTTTTMRFSSGATAGTNPMVLDSSGNVGIGTASPTNLSGYTTLQLNNATNGGMLRVTNGTQTYWNYVNSGGAYLGTFTADSLIIQTNNAERMRITSSGNVDIGGSVPDFGNTLRYFDIYSTNTGQAAGSIIRLITQNTANTGTTSLDMVKYKTGAFNINNNDTSGSMNWTIGGTTRMTLDSSGNLSLGTTGSSQINMSGYNAYGGTGFHTFLQVTNTYGSATTPTKYFRLNAGGSIEIINSAYSAVIYTIDNSGNTTALGSVSLGGTIKRTSAGQGWLDGGYASIETSATTGAIYSIGGSYYPTSSSLNTMYGVGYTYTGTNQFSIGTTSGAGNNLWGLYVSGNGSAGVFLDTGGNIYGAAALTMKGNVTAYSDERVKTNWRDLQSDFIEQLAKVKHGIYDRTDQELTQVGVSAQSLQPVLEHAVLKNDHEQLSVAYGNAALVSAVKLAQRVVELTNKLTAIEAKLEKLTGPASKTE